MKKQWKCPECGTDVKVISDDVAQLYYGTPCEEHYDPDVHSPFLEEEEDEEEEDKIPARSEPTKTELWKIYKKLVWELTEEQPIHTLPNSERRGFRDYHLDHIVPIKYGWKKGINPHLIASIDNLRFIPYQENMEKGVQITEESKEVLDLLEIPAP